MESVMSMYLPFIVLLTSSLILIVNLHLRKIGQRSDIVKRSCQTVLLVMLGYVVCSTPYAVTALLHTEITPEMYLLFRFLLQAHCLFNPIIYIFKDRNFRRAMSMKRKRRGSWMRRQDKRLHKKVSTDHSDLDNSCVLTTARSTAVCQQNLQSVSENGQI